MGWPSLWGDFLSGDDLMLILRMPLVSDPSWSHALQLIFTKAHADLYQPVPLLTFSWDFVVAGWLGIAPDPDGTGRGALLFHISNVLLHAGNAVLVWWLVRRLLDSQLTPDLRDVAAAMVALIFAVHPLNTESVAWLNGRMTLLSCGFEFAALIAADKLLSRWRAGTCALVIVFTVLSMASKIRIELPVLLLILPLMRHERPSGRWWIVWAATIPITVGFTLWNLQTTEAVAQSEWGRAGLHGSRVARGFISLGWYLTRVVWPVGLSPWYPPVADVSWTDGATLLGIGLVVGVGALALWRLRHSQVVLLGLVWFMAAIGPTLYLTAVRRAQAADRYTYQANVGLFLIVVWCLLHAYLWVSRRWSRSGAVVLGAATWCVAITALLCVSWKAAGYYRNNLARDQRIADLFPDEPGVWERMAWVFFREGGNARAAAEKALAEGDVSMFNAAMLRVEQNYDEAVRLASLDLQKHPGRMKAESLQVLGMVELRTGQAEAAIETLRAAVEANPNFSKGFARLGQAYDETGQYELAIKAYERSLELEKAYAPAKVALAELYRKVGRLDDAHRIYVDLIGLNSFDIGSQRALAQLEIQRGRFHEARAILERLLEVLPSREAWQADRAHARTNLGVCLASLGDIDGAIREYQTVLASEPGAVTAAVNLASLLSQVGRGHDAVRLLESAPLEAPREPVALATLVDALFTHGAFNKAGQLLSARPLSLPDDAPVLARVAWLDALHGRWELVESRSAEALEVDPGQTLAAMGLSLSAMANAGMDRSIERLSAALQRKPHRPPEATNHMIAALSAYSSAHPDEPWPFYLAAMVLIDQANRDAARMSIDLFKQLSNDEVWKARAEEILNPEP